MSRGWRIVLILSLAVNLAILYVGYKALEYRSHINEYLDKYTNVVAEFSQREVFAGDNAALQSDSTVPGRVVFFGTQVTVNWPLADSFGEYEAIGRGVVGQRVAGLVLRFWPDVVALGPEAVVIEVSSYNFRSNTTPGEIGEYVATMTALARAREIVPVVMTVTPPTADFQVFEEPDYSVKDTVAAYNRWLRTWAAINHVPLVDAAAAVSREDGYLDEKLASSRVDLNEIGYARVSELIRLILRAEDVTRR